MARQKTGASMRVTLSVPNEDIVEVREFIDHFKTINISYSAQLVSFMVRENEKRRKR